MSELFVIAALLMGIVIGRLWGKQGKPEERKGTRARERPRENREAQRAAAVFNRELQNMWEYNGDVQPKIDKNTILEKR